MEKSRQVGPVETKAPPYEQLCSEGFGKSHGEVEGAPVTNDSLMGGSTSPVQKGDWKASSGGVGKL